MDCDDSGVAVGHVSGDTLAIVGSSDCARFVMIRVGRVTSTASFTSFLTSSLA